MPNDLPATLRSFSLLVAELVGGEPAAVELFRLFNHLALLRYEESESSGVLWLGPAGTATLSVALALVKPVDMHEVRGVRKLLQISAPDFPLVCDGQLVYGFGRAAIASAGVVVEFLRFGVWQVSAGLNPSLQIEAHDFALGTDAGLEKRAFTTGLLHTFGKLSALTIDTLWDLIAPAARQTRGTNVLISPQAAAEAARLASQGTAVRPTRLTPDQMERITAIDGTVILDLDGVCHAIGVILDGAVSRRGDRSRGGRYNSAVMYVDSCPAPGLIVVVSQDGLIDLVYTSKTGASR